MHDRLSVALSLLLGAIVGISTFQGGALIADAGLLLVWATLRHRPPWWAYAVAVPVGVTAIWGSTWWVPLWTAARVLGLSAVFTSSRVRAPVLALGLTAMMFTQTLGVMLAVHILRESPELIRPSGFTANASVLGQLGLAATMLAPVSLLMPVTALAGAATVGVAVARASLLSLFLYAAAVRNRVLLATSGAVILAGAGAILVSGGSDRVTFEGLRSGLTSRQELAAADSARFTVFGYGYDSYVQKTGAVRSHVVPLIAIYELGVLALPLAGVFAWAVNTRRLPWEFVVALMPLWAFTEEHWSAAAGHYLFCTMAIAAAATRSRAAGQLFGSNEAATRRSLPHHG